MLNKSFSMQKIVVPTDFSKTSGYALRYAHSLSETIGFDLEVVHIHDGYGSNDRIIATKGNQEARIEAQRLLDEFIRDTIPQESVRQGQAGSDVLPALKSREIVGAPISAIIEISQEHDCIMIIMGGVGSGVISRVTPLFGSIAKSVAMKSECPVLLVPQNTGTLDVKVASIAFNKIEDLEDISAGFDFLRKAIDPKMRFVHVRDKDVINEEYQETRLLNTVTDTSFPGYSVELDLLKPGNTADRLLDYTLESKVDLLITGHRKRNLFKRIFSGSEISSMLEKCGIPLLVIPVEDV